MAGEHLWHDELLNHKGAVDVLVDLLDACFDGLVTKVFAGHIKGHCICLIINQDANVVFAKHFCNLLIGIFRVGLIVEN